MYFKCIKGFASISLKPAHSTKVQFTAATRCTERGQFHAGANHSLSARYIAGVVYVWFSFLLPTKTRGWPPPPRWP